MKSATSKVVTALDVSVVVMAIVSGVYCGLFSLNDTLELNARLNRVRNIVSKITFVPPQLQEKNTVFSTQEVLSHFGGTQRRDVLNNISQQTLCQKPHLIHWQYCLELSIDLIHWQYSLELSIDYVPPTIYN